MHAKMLLNQEAVFESIMGVQPELARVVPALVARPSIALTSTIFKALSEPSGYDILSERNQFFTH